MTPSYVEHCWSGIVEPSSTLLLRRMPVLWTERAPAEISASELSRSIGLGVSAGSNSRLMATLKRLVQFGLARYPGPSDDHLAVCVEVAPLTPRQLARLPEWTRTTHDRLFAAHLEGLASTSERHVRIATVTARLDHLQHRAGQAASLPTGLERGVGR